MFKLIGISILCASLVGCTTLAGVDAAVSKAAPATCTAIQGAYAGYIASGHGSIRDKEVIKSAYEATASICADPSHATAQQLAVVVFQLGIIVKTLKKVRA